MTIETLPPTAKQNSLGGIFTLFLAAFFWGTTFVAQRMGMDFVEPNTYLWGRSVIGGLILIPIALFFSRKEVRKGELKLLLVASFCCGSVLFFASLAQQAGIQYTTVAKSGFLTSLYIVIVPMLLIFAGIKIQRNVIIGAIIALVGLYLLCFPADATDLSFSLGDSLTLLCALFFSFHILVVGYFVDKVSPVMLACLQLWVCAAWSFIAMVVFETPAVENISLAGPSILYAGIFSSGVAYTCQILGQRKVEPALTSLIVSLEAVISVIAGWAVLNQILSPRELLGCIIMFGAILLAQKRSKS